MQSVLERYSKLKELLCLRVAFELQNMKQFYVVNKEIVVYHDAYNQRTYCKNSIRDAQTPQPV